MLEAQKAIDLLVEKYSYQDAQELAKKITQDYAKSFYFAARFLPKEKKNDTYGLYAFCRQTDFLADDLEVDLETKKAALNLWQKMTLEAFEKNLSDNPILNLFVQVCSKYQIPQKLAFDLIDGVKLDLSKNRYQSYQELEKYCYLVASVPGLMMTHLLGFSDQKALLYAEKLGLAMQLTNILRDVWEDFGNDRIYLPLKDLERFGYSLVDLETKKNNGALQEFLKFYIQKARDLYSESSLGIIYLSKEGQKTAKIASKIYSGILSEIENQNYDIFTKRASVNIWKKLWIVVSNLFS
jgi:phytoene synthase